MPQYVYHCDTCGTNIVKWSARIPAAVPGATPCPCGKPARRSWQAEHVGQPDLFKPYLTDNMGHEPVFVRSKAHEKQLCKERNLERIS